MSHDACDPKKLLRCPSGCGRPLDFRFCIRPCIDCGTMLCEGCQKLWQGARYCKRCLKKRLDARARGQCADDPGPCTLKSSCA